MLPICKSHRFSKKKRQDIAKPYIKDGDLHCGICGEIIKKGWTVDHIIPKSRGGNNDLSNLQPTHGKCNNLKADKG